MNGGLLDSEPQEHLDRAGKLILNHTYMIDATHYQITAKINLRTKDIFLLVGYVKERLWWPIQSPNIGRKKNANS